MKKETGFKDKKGRVIFHDDVISDGHKVWRVLDENTILNCTDGYGYDLTQEFFNQYNRIGKFEDLRDLFECD